MPTQQLVQQLAHTVSTFFFRVHVCCLCFNIFNINISSLLPKPNTDVALSLSSLERTPDNSPMLLLCARPRLLVNNPPSNIFYQTRLNRLKYNNASRRDNKQTNTDTMDVQKYLDRIGFEGAVEVSLSCLARLQLSHQTHIPFENLDNFTGRKKVIEAAAVYEQVADM